MLRQAARRMRQPRCAAPQCDLPRIEKCKHVDARCGVLAADPTNAALALANAHFDGPTVMAEDAQCMRQTEAVRKCQNWLCA